MVDLTKLENQTKKLKSLGDMILKEHSDFIEYDPENSGTFIGFGLHKEPAVAVQRVFMSKGTNIVKHCHTEDEYVTVYRGKLTLNREGEHPAIVDGNLVTTSNRDIIIGVNGAIHFHSNEWHEGVALEDTWVISITIPADIKGYPDA